jgi:hypothetical protein
MAPVTMQQVCPIADESAKHSCGVNGTALTKLPWVIEFAAADVFVIRE